MAGFDANRDIAGLITNRWGHAYIVDPPGFFFGKGRKAAPKDVLESAMNGCHSGIPELVCPDVGDRGGRGRAGGQRALEVV